MLEPGQLARIADAANESGDPAESVAGAKPQQEAEQVTVCPSLEASRHFSFVQPTEQAMAV